MEVSSERIRIATADGPMAAHLAVPGASGPFPGVVVAMEAFGLNRHIEAVADRIAAEGYVAVAPDFYHRAGDRLADYSNLPKAIGLMRSLTDEGILTDLRATLDALGWRSEVRAERIGMTGFCMGGRITFLAACHLPLQAAACFYGGGIGGLLDRAAGISCPMVLFFAGRDRFIPPSEVESVRTVLADLRKPAEVVVYEDADHGFFCDERESYDPVAAADAWQRLLSLFGTHLGR